MLFLYRASVMNEVRTVTYLVQIVSFIPTILYRLYEKEMCLFLSQINNLDAFQNKHPSIFECQFIPKRPETIISNVLFVIFLCQRLVHTQQYILHYSACYFFYNKQFMFGILKKYSFIYIPSIFK